MSTIGANQNSAYIRDEVEAHQNTKRERGEYPAFLTELARSIKDLL